MKNSKLLAKIALGQILPSICKNVQLTDIIINEETTESNNSIINETSKLINNRLYNKHIQNNNKYCFNDTEIKLEEENKNKRTNYLIKSKEPKLTVLITNPSVRADFNSFIHVYEQSTKSIVTPNNPNNPNNPKNAQRNLITDGNIIVPLAKEKFAYEYGSDIILKGGSIILCINKCGLIGSCSQISSELRSKFNKDNIGLLYNNLEYFTPIFNNENQKLNFNCIKIVFDKPLIKNYTITNVNLYDTLPTKSKYLPINYESLIPVSSCDVCADDILSSETIGKSQDITHAISYSFRKLDNKISINITLTNTSNQTLNNIKYYYAINFSGDANNISIDKASHFKTSPYETGIFCSPNTNIYSKTGIYLRTKDTNSFTFIDNEWDWLYNDKWDKIKLSELTPIEREDLAISGLAFNKNELKSKESWSINFCIGFSHKNDFLSKQFAEKPTGLGLSGIEFSNKLLHNIITTCSDLTNCDLTGADLSNNSLEGAITGPLAPNCRSPSTLPKGYKFVISNSVNKEKYIVGPGVVLRNCELVQIDFSNLNLSRCDFTGSNLSGCTFTNTILSGLKTGYHKAHNNNSLHLSGYTIRSGILLGYNLIYIEQNFSNIDLSRLNLSGCTFIGCNFSFANISNTNFSNCIFTNIIPGPFTNINAVNVILPVEYQLIKLANGTSCIAGPKVNFSNFDLSNSSLSGINLLQVNFSNTIMNNTILSNSKFNNTITGPISCIENNIVLPNDYKLVSGTNNPNKYIVGPNVSLINNDLSYFDLSNVNLSGSKLFFSNLSYTNLSNTNLENTYLPSVIGPLNSKSNKPKNYEKTMSLENFDNTQWLIYRWEHYNWDKYLSQLHRVISKK